MKEGHEQAQHRLVRAAEERVDWQEKEDSRRKRVKLDHREANNHAQQKCWERKRVTDIADGVRDVNGKIKKVWRHPSPWRRREGTDLRGIRFPDRVHFAHQKPQS